MTTSIRSLVFLAALTGGCANLGGDSVPADTDTTADTDINSSDRCWIDADGDGATGTMIEYTGAMPQDCATIANDCDDADRNIQTGCAGGGAIIGGDDQSQPWDGLASDGVFITSLGGLPAYIVGNGIAADLANTQFATAGGTGEEAYFFIPDEVTPGRANPAQDLSLYGYGLGGMVDWQVSLIDLVAVYDVNLQFVGFGQAVTPGIYRVNCAASGLLGDDIVDNWCNLEVLQRSSDYLLTFQECGQVKQSICFQVDDGDVFEAEADCLGLYDSPCDQDDDFDGDDTVDDEPTPTVRCYRDTDGDGYGDGGLLEIDGTSCSVVGYASIGGDCAPSDRYIRPGATEVDDDQDNDCDGSIDEGFTPGGGGDCRSDDDRDGYGDVIITPADGDCLDAGEATRAGDCDDTNSTVNPGATEIIGNDVDEDCDGLIERAGGAGTVTVQFTLDPATPAGTREYWIYNETDAVGGWDATPCARTTSNTATCTVAGGSGDVLRLNGETGTAGNDQWFWYASGGGAADWISALSVNGSSMSISTSVVTSPVAGAVRPRDNGTGGYNGVLIVP